ncbi:NOP protein chaperone 1-like isoform X2 [Myxocyprinus asiaticus]|uniref:NOP protein chaperone 1-like isoform X2 n=1 Tax=Myxocyprinus asiaticus TaxID=70543 RepID=UPI002223DB0C|nr:NOP protein chaperone 1-like isoform X2 [Myxocyprinus asiaticus]
MCSRLSCDNCLTMAQTQSNIKKTSSRDLLSCGTAKGIHEKLLLKSKSAPPLQTERMPRNALYFYVVVLDRLQSFLPQIAQANESLRHQMEEVPDGYFDIESVEDAEKVIEMDVALVELENSDSSNEDESSSSSSEDDSSEEGVATVTAETLKLQGDRKRKSKIQNPGAGERGRVRVHTAHWNCGIALD